MVSACTDGLVDFSIFVNQNRKWQVRLALDSFRLIAGTGKDEEHLGVLFAYCGVVFDEGREKSLTWSVAAIAREKHHQVGTAAVVVKADRPALGRRQSEVRHQMLASRKAMGGCGFGASDF